MREFIITETKSDEAVLVGLITRNQTEDQAKEYLDELDFLSRTAGVEPVVRFLQRLEQPRVSGCRLCLHRCLASGTA